MNLEMLKQKILYKINREKTPVKPEQFIPWFIASLKPEEKRFIEFLADDDETVVLRWMTETFTQSGLYVPKTH